MTIIYLSKEWWRIFIRQASAAGFILRSVKPATFGTSIQGAYAQLEENAIAGEGHVLLPACNDLQSLHSTEKTKSHSKL